MKIRYDSESRPCSNGTRQLLRRHIHPDYGEASDSRKELPQQAVDNATSESLLAFMTIHEEIVNLVAPNTYRTRYVGVATSTGGFGISYYTDPIVSKATNRSNTEIQAILLPTKSAHRGSLELYCSGHEREPASIGHWRIERLPSGEPKLRAGLPVFRGTVRPRGDNVDEITAQLTTAFTSSSIYRATN